MPRFPARWPSEREAIDAAVESSRGLGIEERLLRTLELSAEIARLSSAPDPYGDEEERIGNEALASWIRHERERRASSN